MSFSRQKDGRSVLWIYAAICNKIYSEPTSWLRQHANLLPRWIARWSFAKLNESYVPSFVVSYHSVKCFMLSIPRLQLIESSTCMSVHVKDALFISLSVWVHNCHLTSNGFSMVLNSICRCCFLYMTQHFQMLWNTCTLCLTRIKMLAKRAFARRDHSAWHPLRSYTFTLIFAYIGPVQSLDHFLIIFDFWPCFSATPGGSGAAPPRQDAWSNLLLRLPASHVPAN